MICFTTHTACCATPRHPSQPSSSSYRGQIYHDHLLSRDGAGPKHACASAVRGLVLSDRRGLTCLHQWIHLPDARGSIFQAPGFLAPHRYSLEGMTDQSKGLGVANLPQTLFGITSINLTIELEECEPGREHIVLRLSSNVGLPASANLWGLSVDTTIVRRFCAYLVNRPLNYLN